MSASETDTPVQIWTESYPVLGGEETVECQSGFWKSPHFNTHQVPQEEEESIQNNLKLLKYQKSTKTPRATYICPECRLPFRVKENFTEHLKTHVGLRPYQCTICDKSFSLEKYLIVHLRTHLGKGQFPCTECESIFGAKGPLTVHMRKHSVEVTFYCTECRKHFSSQGNLKRHQRLHLGAKPYQCTECEKWFMQKEYLLRHQKLHTENCTVAPKMLLRPRFFHCTKCRKRFTRKQYLIDHQRVHKKRSSAAMTQRYQNTNHEKNIGVHINLNKHQKTHIRDRDNKCIECKNTLRQIRDHIRHHRACKDETSYQCTECEKSFSQHTHHIIQERKHPGERNGKTHMIMAKLLEVSVPNEYFIGQDIENKDFQKIQDAIRETLKMK